LPETIIPIGPYHPALKEPEFFQLIVEGEKIVDVKMRMGYIHRGIEFLASKKTIHQIPVLVERICGICSHCHPTCFCQAVEDAGDIEVPDRARYIRTIIAELERIHSHLLWAGVAAHLIGYDTLFMYFWRYREPVCNLFELLTGNRQNYAMECVGGVRRDIDFKMSKDKILKVLSEIKPAILRLANSIAEDPVVKARMVGIGVLSQHDARKYCVVGPTARGSGLKIDVRICEPYDAYKEVGVDMKVFTEGDAMARTLVRIHEVLESMEIIGRAIDAIPNGPIQVELKEPPKGEGVGKVEAPRGEDIHYVALNGTVIPERLKVRAPSYVNLPSLTPQLIGHDIADAPIIIGAVDPCMSCTDRMVSIVDRKRNDKVILSLEELAQFGRKNKNPLKVRR